eukprot:6619205-Prymnesium_polylepis.1
MVGHLPGISDALIAFPDIFTGQSTGHKQETGPGPMRPDCGQRPDSTACENATCEHERRLRPPSAMRA